MLGLLLNPLYGVKWKNIALVSNCLDPVWTSSYLAFHSVQSCLNIFYYGRIRTVNRLMEIKISYLLFFFKNCHIDRLSVPLFGSYKGIIKRYLYTS